MWTLSLNSVIRFLVFAMPVMVLCANRGAVVMLGLLAVCGLVALRRGQWHPPRDRVWIAALVLFLVWAGLSALWANTAGLALPKTFEMLGLSVAGLFCLGLFRGLEDEAAAGVLAALLAGLVVAAAMAAVDTATNMPLARLIHGFSGHVIPILERIYVSKTIACVAAVWAVLAAGACLMRRRYLAAGAALACAVVIAWVSNGHIAVLALAAGLGMMALAALVPRIGAALLALVLIGGFASGPFASAMPSTESIVETVRFLPHSALHRSAIWKFTGQRIDERVWLGWGMDNSRALPGGNDMLPITLEYGDAPMPQQLMPLHPHNFFLQVWVELGAGGAILFLGLMLALLWRIAQAEGMTRVTGLATMAAALIVGSTAFGAWQSWWLACLWYIAAIGAVVLRPRPGA